MSQAQTGGHFPGWRGERADWVMAGWTNPDGTVTVLASTKLSQSELQHRARDYQFRDFADMAANLRNVIEVTLTAHMGSKDFVTVHAPDYPSAMADLFRQWRPEMSERHALGPTQTRPLTPSAALADAEARRIERGGGSPIAAGEDVIDAEVVDVTAEEALIDEVKKAVAEHPGWCAHRHPHPGQNCSILHERDCSCLPPEERFSSP